CGPEGAHALDRKLHACFTADDEQREQARQMSEMSGDEDVARFAAEPIANPLRRVVRLEVARCRELREGVARAPEGLGRLLRAQLSAVPDHGRFCTAGRRLRSQTFDTRLSRRRPGT